MAPSKRIAVVQSLLLTLCAIALIALAIDILSGGVMSDSERGFQLSATPQNTPLLARVSYVAPGGPAARSGLRAGDVIDLRRLSPFDRYRAANGVSPGERLNIPILRGNRRLMIHDTGGYVPLRWDVGLNLAGTIWAVLVAALLIWKRPEQAEARVLCLLLLGITVPVFLSGGSWVSSSAAFDAVLNIVATEAWNLTIPLLATYALLFARPPSRIRRLLALFSWAFAFVVAAVWVWGQIDFLRGVILPGHAILANPLFGVLLNGGEWLLPLLCILATVRAAENPERDRIVWTSATIGAYYAYTLLFNVVAIVFPALTSTPLLRTEQMISDVTGLLMPIGMAYAVLNRRVLDIGFALNRAVVFSGVSVIVVGAFVLVEWLVSDWLQRASHSTNLLFGAGLALTFGFSVRFVRGKVDYFVDHFFFRERRLDEEALRDMARQAPYITDRAVLLRRIEETLLEHAGASFVTILSRDEAGRYSGIDENDPAIVALRAYHKVLDLHSLVTAVRGEWAYPMVARGELIAALILGTKRSGESYAPDESAAIAELAHSAAAALDVLSTHGRPKPDAALERIEELLVSVLDRLPRLPEAQN